jgi:hypothetical protein
MLQTQKAACPVQPGEAVAPKVQAGEMRYPLPLLV